MSAFGEFWPWWLGASALALVSVGFAAFLRRPFGVSGIFARALRPVEGLRDDRERAALAERQKEDAAESPPAGDGPVRAHDGYLAHVVFVLSIAVGGFLGAASVGRVGVSSYGGAFVRLLGDGAPAWIALLVGGLFVGFGTQMAGGCTSGHGLTGCSRAQPASLLSTATFFGTGILVSLLLQWVLA